MPPRNMAKYDIAILGGDRRTACLAPIFAEKAFRVVWMDEKIHQRLEK